MLLAGVDGGGTKTVCVVADENGRVLGLGSSGPSNYHVTGLAASLEVVGESLRKASGWRHVDYLTVGLAGLDTRYDVGLYLEALRRQGLAGDCHAMHDAEIALLGGTGGGPGIIVIAGTGSVASGMNRSGRYARAGGWGYILGDEGSAYDIGRRGLVAVLRAYDGRGRKTALTEKLLKALGVSNPEEMLRRVYVDKMGVTGIAALAAHVTEAAAEGDPVALDIVRSAAESLAELAIAVGARLGMLSEHVRIVTVGGVFKAGELVLKPFREKLRTRFASFELMKPLFPPVIGALLASYKRAGIPVAPLIPSLMAQCRALGLKTG